MGLNSAVMGARVRALRQSRGLTQEKLAERAGVHPSYLAKIEAGVAVPSLQVLARLADSLGVSAAYILDSSPQRESHAASDIMALLQTCGELELTFFRKVLAILLEMARSLADARPGSEDGPNRSERGRGRTGRLA